MWNTPETWQEDPTAFPNRPVLLLVQITIGANCLVDDVKGAKFCTMGRWFPKVELDGESIEDGHWDYVGWNWEQDCFIGTRGDKVIGWMELPKTKDYVKGGS